MCRRDGLVSIGKDDVLQVCEAKIDSWFCRKHFNIRHRC